MRKRLERPRTEPPHDHDLGLVHDMSVMLSRRRALWIMDAVGTTPVVAACSSGTGTTGSSAPAAAASTAAAPQETAGPYPGDGSDGPNRTAGGAGPGGAPPAGPPPGGGTSFGNGPGAEPRDGAPAR